MGRHREEHVTRPDPCMERSLYIRAVGVTRFVRPPTRHFFDARPSVAPRHLLAPPCMQKACNAHVNRTPPEPDRDRSPSRPLRARSPERQPHCVRLPLRRAERESTRCRSREPVRRHLRGGSASRGARHDARHHPAGLRPRLHGLHLSGRPSGLGADGGRDMGRDDGQSARRAGHNSQGEAQEQDVATESHGGATR